MSLSKLSNDSDVPKWQYAIAFGGVLLAGAGIYYLIKSQTNKPVDQKSVLEPKEDVTQPKGNVEVPQKTTNEKISEEPKVSEPKVVKPKTKFEIAEEKKFEGNSHFKKQSYQEAIECYDEAIRTCPSDKKSNLAKYYQNRAAAYEQLGKYKEVIADCTKALEFDTKYIKAFIRRGKAYESSEQYTNSLEDLTGACILESFNNPTTLESVDKILKTIGKAEADEAMKTRKPNLPSPFFIKSYLNSFCEDPVMKNLYDEVEQDKDAGNEKSGYLMARECLRKKQYDQIITYCTNELNDPESCYKYEAHLLRGTIHRLMMNNQSCMTDFNIIIDAEDADIKVKSNAMIKRGTLYMQLEDINECRSDFDKAALADPTNADVFHHRGQLNLLQDEPIKAMEDFSKAVESNQNFAMALIQKNYTEYSVQKGSSTLSGNELKPMLAKFKEILEQFPTCVECFILYAQILIENNDYDSAEKVFDDALALNPDCPTIYVHKGILSVQKDGDVSKARRLIQKALAIDDKCEIAYENLATIEVQTGQLKRGIELFDKAIPLANSRAELAHLYSVRHAAVAQLKIVEKFNLQLPTSVE